MVRQLVFPFLMIGTETIEVCEGGGEPRVSEQVITFLLRDILCFVLFHTLKHLLYGVLTCWMQKPRNLYFSISLQTNANAQVLY